MVTNLLCILSCFSISQISSNFGTVVVFNNYDEYDAVLWSGVYFMGIGNMIHCDKLNTTLAVSKKGLAHTIALLPQWL